MTHSKRTVAAIAVAAVGVTVFAAGTAYALSNISLTLGTTPSYDFGAYGGTQPATIQFHTFVMKPGDTIPWHQHKALSYVVLERGKLRETHMDETTGQCVSEEFSAGSAFIEQPGVKHTVTNSGRSVAVITWATAFPSSDGVLRISPRFVTGGVYFVNAPCES